MYSMINILVLLILFYVDYTSSKKLFNIHKYGKGAWAHSTEIKIHCFSGDSSIRLSNGENKNISYLKSGDEILTIDQSKIVSTEMIMMLDKQISTEVVFYKLITKSGHEISLTEYHLIPILNSNQNQIYLFAKQIQIGDFLYVVSNDLLNYSPVINITVEIKKGYYAPLTIKGTLLVNDVLASCFAYAKNHHSAQFYMFPFRFYYKLTRAFNFTDPLKNHNSEGLHWFIKIMFNFAKYFRPDTLFS
ncbi:unnamed protein product [Rotaria magnacalcarata]|uniref:Hint domain-containing protein n=2 Tax=Rotaria magnacalcarata TaxID=392030 RepID=A0A816NJY6_9BILA|nr:unnamed protein product [Rotaria magnacalcarata]CAF2035596.1 unnamed protein product [Rotaria magnacalcarata]CAF2042642.1 unnamed protein product [Rotaria magnacalcarata]CAF2190299.1 unnamed protein product [Rotaria magnacalcarata]